MKNEISEKGAFNTLGTSIKSGLAKKRDAALGDFGGAKERLGLRVAADQNMKTWVNWITRQRYGGEKVEGNADDLRRFIKQTYGDYALQQVEPAIQRVSQQTTQAPPQQIPAPAAPAAVASTATPAISAPAASNAAPAAAATPAISAPAASNAAPAAAATPASTPAAAPVAAAPKARASRAKPVPVAPANPEVPDWLAKQRNATSTANPPPMDIPPTPRERMDPPPAKARGRSLPSSNQYPQRYTPTAPVESTHVKGNLIEDALPRSAIDMVLKQLAIAQMNHRDSQQPGQQIPTPGSQTQANPTGQAQISQTQQTQGTPTGQAQPNQAANGQQQRQQSAPINVSQILSAQVSVAGLRRTNANLSPVDKGRIDDALSNGSTSLEELLNQLPELRGATVVGLLKALEHSN